MIRILIMLLLISTPAMARTYYVDPTHGDDGHSGLSDAQSWATLDRVNKDRFSSGDDIYIKCGGQLNNEKLTIDWPGSADNYVTIGAYYMDGNKEVVGVRGAKPIIQGNIGSFPSNDWSGLVNWDIRFVKIENLHIQASNGVGVYINKNGTSGIIEHCKINNINRQAIIINQASDCLVQYNDLSDADNIGSGAVITAPRSHGTSVFFNFVHESKGWSEGINAYRSTDMEIAYNVVRNTWAAGIYMDQAVRPHVHHNLVYYTDDKDYWRYDDSPAPGLWAADEPNPIQRFSNAKIHDNLIANVREGFYMDTPKQGTTLNDTVIFNNTFIPSANGRCFTINNNAHSNSTIANNICQDNSNPAAVPAEGVTWNNNVWTAPSSAVNDAAKGAGDVYNAITDFANNTWDGSVMITPASFSIGSDSDAIDAAGAIAAEFALGWDVRKTQFDRIPFFIATLDRYDYGWDAGATVYTETDGITGTIQRDDNPSQNFNTQANKVTVSHRTTVAPDFAKVTIFWRDTSPRAVSSVTYDGNPATLALTSGNSYTYGRVAVYYLLDDDLPDTGDHNIVVTMDSVCMAVDVVVETFSGVRQAPPQTTNTDDIDNDGFVTSAITATEGSWLLDAVINNIRHVPAAPGTGQSEAYNRNTVGKRTGISAKQIDTAGTDSMSWTIDGDIVQHLVLSIAPRNEPKIPAPEAPTTLRVE